jgi:hypothetical protein
MHVLQVLPLCFRAGAACGVTGVTATDILSTAPVLQIVGTGKARPEPMGLRPGVLIAAQASDSALLPGSVFHAGAASAGGLMGQPNGPQALNRSTFARRFFSESLESAMRTASKSATRATPNRGLSLSPAVNGADGGGATSLSSAAVHTDMQVHVASWADVTAPRAPRRQPPPPPAKSNFSSGVQVDAATGASMGLSIPASAGAGARAARVLAARGLAQGSRINQGSTSTASVPGPLAQADTASAQAHLSPEPCAPVPVAAGRIARVLTMRKPQPGEDHQA